MQVAEFPANGENKVTLWGSLACFVVVLRCLKFDLWRLWLACSPSRFSSISDMEIDKGETTLSGETIAGMIIAKFKKQKSNCANLPGD